MASTNFTGSITIANIPRITGILTSRPGLIVPTSLNTAVSLTAIYRGVSGSQFVYANGSPPVGATNVVIIGRF